MENFEKKYNVSHETFLSLQNYLSLLIEWQKKINLVSASSLKDAWNRHFEDSVQLFKYVPLGAKSLADFGSGAGFPGMVLAIIAKEKAPYLKITLFESIKKKTLYLKEVSQKTKTDVFIVNDRIENIKNDRQNDKNLRGLDQNLITNSAKTYKKTMDDARKEMTANTAAANNKKRSKEAPDRKVKNPMDTQPSGRLSM